MGPDIKKLLCWFDKRTGKKLDDEALTKGVSECSPPPTMREALRKFKRKSWASRESLVCCYLAETEEA